MRHRSWVLALALGMVGCQDEGAPPTRVGMDAWFVDEAASRGLDFVHVSGFETVPYLPEIVGAGTALFDVDGDGDLDAYFVQSGSLARPGEAGYDVRNELFKNDGSGRFTKVDPGAAADSGYGMGVAAGDYDNDGDIDLFVTNVGENKLFANDGRGFFTDVTVTAGLGDPRWGTGAAWLDLDADDDLDLVALNYISWELETELRCYVGNKLTYCPPANYNAPVPDLLYENNGDGTFTDVSLESGMTGSFGNGFGVVGADFNGSGRTDFFVANDMMLDQFWVNRGDLRFSDEAMLWGSALDGHGIAKAGMGVAAADIDNDADIDVMVVNLEGQTDSFFRNEGTHFRDATAELGLGLTGKFTRFGVTLSDFNNDTFLDLYEANGKVSAPSPTAGNIFDEPNVLLIGGPRRFTDASMMGGTAESLVHTSRGLAVGDVDGDGGLDLLITNRDASAYLLMNRAPRGNWIRFAARLTPGSGNIQRDAYSATIAMTVGSTRFHRNVQPDGSYLSYSDPRVHVGLADAAAVTDVTVRWPGTTDEETFGDFEANQTVVLIRGEGEAVVQRP